MLSSPSVSRKQGIKQRGGETVVFAQRFCTNLPFFSSLEPLNPAPIAVQSRCGGVISCKFTPLEGNWTSSLAWTMFFSFLFSFLKSRDGDEGKKKSVAVLHYLFFSSLDNLAPTLRSKSSCLPVAASPPTIPPSSNLRCEFLPSQRRGKKLSEKCSLLRSFNLVFPV